jgi:hypothetical protein
MLGATTVTDGALRGSVAHADSSDDDVIARSAWASLVTSRTFEPYAEIPHEFYPGAPITQVRLDTPAPKCETWSAGAWASYELEEGILPGYVPGNLYKNPTFARAANPPFESTYTSAPEKSEIAPAGADKSPYFASECPTALSGKGVAREAGLVGQGFSVGGATSASSEEFVPSQHLITGETTTSLTDIKVGSSGLRAVDSWLKVDLGPDKEPVVSYRITLQGISGSEGGTAGGSGDVAAAGDQGIVIAGQQLPGSELVKQFNDQAAAHAKDLAQLGVYGFHLVAPKFSSDGGRYLVEAPVVDGDLWVTARKNQTGNGQGLRIGMTRFFGTYSETTPTAG